MRAYVVVQSFSKKDHPTYVVQDALYEPLRAAQDAAEALARSAAPGASQARWDDRGEFFELFLHRGWWAPTYVTVWPVEAPGPDAHPRDWEAVACPCCDREVLAPRGEPVRILACGCRWDFDLPDAPAGVGRCDFHPEEVSHG